mmetsp:Transcript_7463/g.16451  ORF Transcript_7463/g.16451 Transcript_7463/m.16451 type:complete len:166 (-) Transcript_7463:407-904(-)|eukprot:6205438-Pleurochrysis_carterae.AAC.3
MPAAMLALLLLQSTSAALLPRGQPLMNRRIAIGGAASLLVPFQAVHAISNPWDKGEVNFKPREEKKRMRPDGFGGYIERDEPVKTPILSILEQKDEDDEPAAPAPVKAPPAKKKAVATSTASSAPALSLDDMVTNSVRSKEEIMGRPLEPSEVAEIRSKLAKLAP